MIMIMIFPAAVKQLNAQDKAIEKVITDERKEENERRRVIVGDNSWLEVHLLLQAQAYTQNIFDTKAGETTSDETWSNSFQIRRARIMLSGQAAKNVEYFLETDDINIGGKGPAANNSADTTYTDSANEKVTVKDQKGTYIQDAYINYKLADELEVSIGMMLLPFMHHNRQSAVSLLGIDYNTTVVPLNGTTNVWRDTGVEIRGLLFETAGNKKGLFDYRLGVWRGFADRNMKGNTDKEDDINPEASPRFCGRIQMNIVDAETGFFYSGNYLGKKSIFSIGGGADYQNDAVRNPGNQLKPYFGWTTDLAVDLPIGNDYVLAVQGAFVRVKNKPYETGGGYSSGQLGFFAQAGFLLFNKIQPVLKYMKWKDSDKGDTTEYFVGGAGYFIDGHKANIKAEYQMPWNDDHKNKSGEKKATVQCQIFI